LRKELDVNQSSFNELEACVKRSITEKEEIRLGLEAAESKIGAGEVKLAGMVLEVAKAKQEVERVGYEKDEEIKVNDSK
jgi:hypothetical protein